jgi:hypothetical protein
MPLKARLTSQKPLKRSFRATCRDGRRSAENPVPLGGPLLAKAMVHAPEQLHCYLMANGIHGGPCQRSRLHGLKAGFAHSPAHKSSAAIGNLRVQRVRANSRVGFEAPCSTLLTSVRRAHGVRRPSLSPSRPPIGVGEVLQSPESPELLDLHTECRFPPLGTDSSRPSCPAVG